MCGGGGDNHQKIKYTRDRQLPESLADSRQLSSDRRTGGLCLRQDDKNWLFAINDEVRSKERRLKDKEKKNESEGGGGERSDSLDNKSICHCICSPPRSMLRVLLQADYW